MTPKRPAGGEGLTIIRMRNVHKDYRGLRPLRIGELVLAAGERASILGIDGPAAEVFVNLLTGASLPDAGDIHVFDTPTSSITDSADWLRLLDRIGIVSARAVLLEETTVAQNMAVPFTLDLDPLSEPVAKRVVALAAETGITRDALDMRTATAPVELRARIKLARAVALDPEVLVLEHASAQLPSPSAEAFACDVARVAGRRRLAVLSLTADRQFAEALGGRLLALQPATGKLRPLSGRARWFS